METRNPTRTPFKSIVPSKAAPDDQWTDVEKLCAITSSIIYVPSSLHIPTSCLLLQNSCNSIATRLYRYYCTAKHLLRDIRGIKDLIITFCRSLSSGSASTSTPIGFSDASFAADPDDRKSSSGDIFFRSLSTLCSPFVLGVIDLIA
jgi:hypothetical protein